MLRAIPDAKVTVSLFNHKSICWPKLFFLCQHFQTKETLATFLFFLWFNLSLSFGSFETSDCKPKISRILIFELSYVIFLLTHNDWHKVTSMLPKRRYTAVKRMLIIVSSLLSSEHQLDSQKFQFLFGIGSKLWYSVEFLIGKILLLQQSSFSVHSWNQFDSELFMIRIKCLSSTESNVF